MTKNFNSNFEWTTLPIMKLLQTLSRCICLSPAHLSLNKVPLSQKIQTICCSMIVGSIIAYVEYKRVLNNKINFDNSRITLLFFDVLLSFGYSATVVTSQLLFTFGKKNFITINHSILQIEKTLMVFRNNNIYDKKTMWIKLYTALSASLTLAIMHTVISINAYNMPLDYIMVINCCIANYIIISYAMILVHVVCLTHALRSQLNFLNRKLYQTMRHSVRTNSTIKTISQFRDRNIEVDFFLKQYMRLFDVIREINSAYGIPLLGVIISISMTIIATINLLFKYVGVSRSSVTDINKVGISIAVVGEVLTFIVSEMLLGT